MLGESREQRENDSQLNVPERHRQAVRLPKMGEAYRAMSAMAKQLEGPLVAAMTDGLHNAPTAFVLRETAQRLGAEVPAFSSLVPFSSVQEVEEHRRQHGPELEEALTKALTQVLLQEREPCADPLHAVAQLLLEQARPKLGHKLQSMDRYNISDEEYREFLADWETLDTNHTGSLITCL